MNLQEAHSACEYIWVCQEASVEKYTHSTVPLI